MGTKCSVLHIYHFREYSFPDKRGRKNDSLPVWSFCEKSGDVFQVVNSINHNLFFICDMYTGHRKQQLF